MQEIGNLHRQAMESADQADVARRAGDMPSYSALTLQAFRLEAAAARELLNEYELEPTRSVLFRSAATLSLEAGFHREAEQLIAAALSGNPPPEIAEELRDLLEDVYFRRHLEVRGVSLARGEIQMTLEGNAVGFGITRSDAFVQRVKDFESLLFRTAARCMGQEFREGGGRRPKNLAGSLELYMSVPRPASFAVTLRLGQSTQMALPGVDLSTDTMKSLLDGLSLINVGDFESLKESIPDDSYRINFMGLAERLAPDGREIRTVGFTSASSEGERVVALSTPRRQLREKIQFGLNPQGADAIEQNIEVTGILLEADATRQKEGLIEIVDAQNVAHRITVPRGMMRDIVKPMFEEEVVATGVLRQGRIELLTINPVESAFGAD